MKIKKSIRRYLPIHICIICVSCDTMPDDLEARKEYINQHLTEISERFEKANGTKEFKAIKKDYLAIKDSVINYTRDCNKRGIEKNNDEAVASIESSLKLVENRLVEIMRNRPLGTWSYSSGGINYHLQILASGRWISEGFQGYASGNWNGDASNIEIYDQGFLSSRGSISDDGTVLHLQTAAGRLDLEKRD